MSGSNNNINATTPSSSSLAAAAASPSFRGFADFAKHTDFATSTTAAALLAARRHQASAASSAAASSSSATATNVATELAGNTANYDNSSEKNNQQQFRPSPIYTGNDARLSLLFRKISQKRSPTTKVRALEDLIREVYPAAVAVARGADASSSSVIDTSSSFSRPDKIAALSHLIYLHETKLGNDNNPSVRALSYMALVCARSHVPKAWSALFLGVNNKNGGSATTATSSIGMAWGAMRGDPATEVSKNAGLFLDELIRAEKEMGKGGNSAPSLQYPETLVPDRKIQVAICQYSKMVLSCKRPSSLQDFIINFNTALSSSASSVSFSSSMGMVVGSPTTAAKTGGGSTKIKKGKNSCGTIPNDETVSTTSAEIEKEEMAERYERVILSVLLGLGWLFECSCGQSHNKEEGEVSDEKNKKDVCYHASSTVLFPDVTPSILRLLTSSRGSFRRGTYMLLGQICQFVPSLLATSSSQELSPSLSMGSLIPNLLSSEKDPSNFVSLFEMILSYLAAAQGGKLGENSGAFRVDDDLSGNGYNCTTMFLDPVAFTTALSKVLRRGCYGAPAAVWGPIILPFVASLPTLHHGGDSSGEELKGRIDGEQQLDSQIPPSMLPLQLTIMSSLWEGRKSAAGVTDTIAIVSAVAECVTFLILRRDQRPPTFTAQSWRFCGQLFLNTLSYYLIEAPNKIDAYGPVALAVDGLCMTISRDLNKLDVSSSSMVLGTDAANNCVGITAVKTWLWGQHGIEHFFMLEEGRDPQDLNNIYRKWDSLLKSLQSLNDGNQSSASQLIPACRKLFHTIVNKNRPCDDDEGRLLLTILQFGQVENIFDAGGRNNSASIERFCVNDLLKWILEHGSTSPSTIKTDFEIFQSCMHSIPSLIHQKQIWETILRELIKSDCDYTTLAIGLGTLTNSEASTNFVRCHVLDTFAIDTANILMNEFRRSHDILQQHDERDNQLSTRGGDVSRFLKSCVGISNGDLSGSRSVIIVSESVIRRWIDLCCERDDKRATTLEENLILEDESGSNILLKIMLDLSSRNQFVISQAETIKLVCVSWFQGGKTWHESVVNRLVSDKALRDQIISIVENSLSEDISSAPPCDEKVLDLICHSWAKRAARLIDVHPAGSLYSIGMGDVLIWGHAASTKGNDAEFLFLCLMYLLDSIGSDEWRRNLLVTNVDLFVRIQVAITKCDALTESFYQRTDRCRQLVDILGGRSMLSRSFLEDCCIHTSDILAEYMNSDYASKNIMMMRGMTSLSYIASLLFPSAFESRESRNKNDSITCDVNPLEVKEGDTLWYDRGEYGTRSKATVLKVHNDDFPRLYFTIKEESTEAERQTVASRLRWTSDEVIESALPKTDYSAQRDRVGRYIADRLVKSFSTEPCDNDSDDDDGRTKREFSAESINIVISQCGLVSLGIGSVRYDIFQAVHSMVEILCTALSPAGGPNLEMSAIVLRKLSLAMGYGFYTIPSQNNVSHLMLDTKQSICQLLQLYENEQWIEAQKKNPLNAFHSCVLMWLAVAVGTETEGELLGRIAKVIFSCSELIFAHDSCNVAIDSIHAMKAMSSLQYAFDHCLGCSSANEDHESIVFSHLTQTFIDLSSQSGLWMESFVSLLQQKCNRSRGNVLHAARTFSNELCGCLFDTTKRWCAFQLLSIYAREHRPPQSDNDAPLPPDIDRQLSEWKKELAEEEAIDLEGDISIAASWLPDYILSLFLNFGNYALSMISDHDMQAISLGNLLAWIVTLDILEVAGSVDMRNRANISTFLQKSNALGFIMNLTLQEADLHVNRDADIFECIALNRGGKFLLHKIATLALFRTVESLPTMVKTWYNDDCPRFLQQKLSVFVENIVAPTTLQRELTRIKGDTSFGDMIVTGSCVSREVVATYQQDECQLSVMIRMPPTFPLRNVEVDCKRTMGIPEKRWRRWALQIMLMLNNQDGSVLDALLLWKQNVDKEFDGVEPCPVCYSVLCIKTHQMPNLECKTCHNRFHTTCLIKWFQSSGKSVCVLCQQPWSGAKR